MRQSEITISNNKKFLNPKEVAYLYVELGWGTPAEYSAARMKRSLEHSDVVVFARNGAHDLIGIARALTDHAIDTKILDLIIAPEYQRQGVGKMIMEEIGRLCKGTAIYCETEKKNFAFVEKCGYKKRKGLTVFVKNAKKGLE